MMGFADLKLLWTPILTLASGTYPHPNTPTPSLSARPSPLQPSFLSHLPPSLPHLLSSRLPPSSLYRPSRPPSACLSPVAMRSGSARDQGRLGWRRHDEEVAATAVRPGGGVRIESNGGATTAACGMEEEGRWGERWRIWRRTSWLSVRRKGWGFYPP